MRYGELAGTIQALLRHGLRRMGPLLALSLMIFPSVAAIAAPAQPRLRIHVSTVSRTTGQAVVDFLAKNNLGRPELRTIKPAPKSNELFYKEGRDELAARIAALLGLRAVLSKELAKTDVAIYLSDSYRLPAASKDGQPGPAHIGGDSGAAQSGRFAQALSELSYSAEIFGLLQAFTSYALKKQDADAMTSLQAGDFGGGASIMVLRPRYAIGIHTEYARMSFPTEGHDSRMDATPLARFVFSLAQMDMLGQLRFGVSMLEPFGSGAVFGPLGAVALGGTVPIPTFDSGRILALAEYHVASYPKAGFDWMLTHGLSIKMGAGFRF